MGDVFRQQYSRKDGRKGESKRWYGQYRDHAGRTRRVPLSTDRGAARVMLAELIRQTERRRAGIEDDFTDSARSPIGELVDLYLADLKLRGRSPKYRKEVRELLGLIITACGFTTPGEMRAGPLDIYLATMEGSARTRAKHRQAIVAFGNYLVRKGKLPTNPLARSTRPEGDVTRKRRALTTDELKRLVAAAKDRPLKDALLIRWGPRAGTYERRIKPGERARLERLGRHNPLLYRVAFYTGFRAEELRALQAGDFVLEGPTPRVFLPRERTKNKRDALVPLRHELAADIKAWIAEDGLSEGDPVFQIPHRSADLLRRDLAAADIRERDSRDRVVDFHALRASLSSHLNSTGTTPSAAKKIMRHGTITLTLDTYHDEAMDDERRAIESLPEV